VGKSSDLKEWVLAETAYYESMFGPLKSKTIDKREPLRIIFGHAEKRINDAGTA